MKKRILISLIVIIIIAAAAVLIRQFAVHESENELLRRAEKAALQKIMSDYGDDRYVLAASKYSEEHNEYYVGFLNNDDTSFIDYVVRYRGGDFYASDHLLRSGSGAHEGLAAIYSKDDVNPGLEKRLKEKVLSSLNGASNKQLPDYENNYGFNSDSDAKFKIGRYPDFTVQIEMVTDGKNIVPVNNINRVEYDGDKAFAVSDDAFAVIYGGKQLKLCLRDVDKEDFKPYSFKKDGKEFLYDCLFEDKDIERISDFEDFSESEQEIFESIINDEGGETAQ